MSETERIVGYVDADTKTDVEQLAKKMDLSVSEYVAEAVEEKVEQDQLGGISEEYSVEMKLLRLVDGAVDRVADEAGEKIADEVVAELSDRSETAAKRDNEGEWITEK